MTTTTNHQVVVHVGYDLDGDPVKVFEDPVEARAYVDEYKHGVAFEDVVKAEKKFRSASRISQILKGDFFPKGQDRVATRIRGYHHSYEGFVVEAPGIYGGFVTIGWILKPEHAGHGRRSHAEAVEEYNRNYERMANRLRKRGFVVVVIPAKVRGYGLTTGQITVVGKNEVTV